MFFSSNAGAGAFHIWRQRFPDGKPEQLTSGPTFEDGIAISPDGKSLITSVGVSSGTVTVHDRSGEPSPLAGDKGVNSPSILQIIATGELTHGCADALFGGE